MGDKKLSEIQYWGNENYKLNYSQFSGTRWILPHTEQWSVDEAKSR